MNARTTKAKLDWFYLISVERQGGEKRIPIRGVHPVELSDSHNGMSPCDLTWRIMQIRQPGTHY